MPCRREELLVAALAFYAQEANWDAVRIPDPDGSPVVEINGRQVEVETWRTGPALDGGEHARYTLRLVEELA